jgi:hypothetical protein
VILLILTLLFGSWQSERWRSDCAIEGMEVPGHDFSGIDYIFTDSLSYVPFDGRRGSVHFLENISSLAKFAFTKGSANALAGMHDSPIQAFATVRILSEQHQESIGPVKPLWTADQEDTHSSKSFSADARFLELSTMPFGNGTVRRNNLESIHYLADFDKTCDAIWDQLRGATTAERREKMRDLCCSDTGLDFYLDSLFSTNASDLRMDTNPHAYIYPVQAFAIVRILGEQHQENIRPVKPLWTAD